MRLWIRLVGWRWIVKYKITENFAPKFCFYIDCKKVILIGLSISWCLMGDFLRTFWEVLRLFDNCFFVLGAVGGR